MSLVGALCAVLAGASTSQAQEATPADAPPGEATPAEAPPAAAARAEAPPRRLRIAVAGNAPFVVRDGERLDGIAVALWSACAAHIGLEHDLVPFETVGTALDALAAGEVDAAIGPISITAERARRVSFSLPYWDVDLAILAPAASASTWDHLAPFASRAFVAGVAGLLLVLALVGTLLWLAERRRNQTFPVDPGRGIAEGAWLAVVTMTTVGYGDRVPVTRTGRTITAIWMIVSMVTASSLTAGIATALTLSQLDRGRIDAADQLRGRAIAVIAGTTSEEFVRRHGARVVTRPDAGSVVEAVASGEAEAAVLDRPLLQYSLRQRPELDLRISEAAYEPQRYGFAFPHGSALRHELSVALLELDESGRIATLAMPWL